MQTAVHVLFQLVIQHFVCSVIYVPLSQRFIILIPFRLFDHFDTAILNIVRLYAVVHECEADLATFHIALAAMCVHKCQVHDVSAFDGCCADASNSRLPLA